MKSYKEKLTYNFLYNEYVLKNKSTRTIGKELGCSREVIRQVLKKYGFKMGTTKSKLTGTTIPNEQRLKIIANRPNRGLFREKSDAWKGDNAGYSAIHIDIQKIFPKPQYCQECGKKTKFLDLANISGKYKRDISDWEYLCRYCHMKKDGRLQNLIKNCPNKNKFTEKDQKNILMLKQQNKKLIDIAKLYNVKYQTIQRILNKKYKEKICVQLLTSNVQNADIN